MKITKRQIRKMLAENFKISSNRFGFLGQGFGESNSFDPYKSARIVREQEELEVPEPVEDVWAGGENLENQVDHEDVYAPELVSERRIRAAIRKVMKK